MIHRSKLKRKINNNIISELFQGWKFHDGKGYRDGDTYYRERTIKDNKGNFICFYISGNKIDYWTANKGNKKHTQLNINDFTSICRNKYNINFKLKSKERI